MSVFRKNKKKLLNFTLGILGTSLVIAPLNYLFEKTNNFVTSNLNSSKANEAKSNNDDVRLSYDNRNADNEGANGVVNIKDSTLIFTSWFNHEVWTYDVKGSESNNTIIRKFFGVNPLSTLKNLRVKYNSYNDAFLVYGSITNTDKKLYSFIIQVDANTGKEIINNNNVNNSLWASVQLGEIDSLVINEENGSITIFPNFSKFSNPERTIIGRCDSSTYTPIWLTFSNLTSSNGFIYNQNNDIPATFYVDENTWGFTYFIKGNSTTPDKYQYFLFDNNLSFVAKTDPIQIGTGNGGNSSKTITTPLIFPYTQSNIKKYKIIDISVTPVYTDNNFNNTFIQGSEALRVHTFTPKNGSNNASINKETVALGLSNYAAYQLKKDNKNNIFYLSGFENNNKSTVNFSKNKIIGYQVNKTNGNITMATKELVDQYTNQKVVTNISIINDKFNKNTKTSLIKEAKNYGKSAGTLSNTTTITSLTQMRYILNPSTTTIINNGVSWTRLTKDDYTSNVNENIKHKLASDVLETDISNLVKYKNGNTIASYVTNEIEEINIETGYQLTNTKKILYNNTEGKIKANVKSNIKKWWYEENDNSITSSLVEKTSIELSGFYTINDLIFKLVTSSSVDNDKWNKIQNDFIGKVLPSNLTKKNILDNFIVKGPKIILEENDVNIVNIDTSTLNTNDSNKKAIEVNVSDKSGTVEIKYDLKSKSSISMEQSNVVGSYSYVGFLNSASNVPIKFNETKFNELKKTKLANQFTKKDLLNVLEASNLYDTKDEEKWELTYNYENNSNEYKRGLLEGKTNFTFKYKKPEDFPSHIQDTNFTINVNSTMSKNFSKNKDSGINGDGCLTLVNYIANPKIQTLTTFNEQNANLLTGTKTLDEVKNNIDSFILQTLTITNGIFKTDQIKADFDETASLNKKAIFNLSFKNENVTSEINVVKKDGSSEEKLMFDKFIMSEIEKTKKDYFVLPKITFNYSLVEFKWNYNFESENNVLELAFDEMVKKVNEDRINNNKNPFNLDKRLLPSDFVNYFANNEKEFHKYFPLISDSKSSSTISLFGITRNGNDPSYYEINKIQMIANDANGTINVRYEIVYPNLSTTSQVYMNPEVRLTGLKSKSTSTTLVIVMITILTIIALIFIIAIPLLLNMKRHRFLSSNLGKKVKRNKLKTKYAKKVIRK